MLCVYDIKIYAHVHVCYKVDLGLKIIIHNGGLLPRYSICLVDFTYFIYFLFIHFEQKAVKTLVEMLYAGQQLL